MTLITKALTEQLLANGRAQRAAMDKNGRSRFEQTLGKPGGLARQGEDQGRIRVQRRRRTRLQAVVKLFAPDAQCTWLLTEVAPDGGLAFGLCDLGMGEPD